MTGCVDRSLFAALVDCGNQAFSYDDAKSVMKLMFEALHIYPPIEMFRPIDSRVAGAVEAGLFEMILNLLIRFKSRAKNKSLLNHIGMTLQSAQSVALQRECTGAIASRHDSITAALQEYDQDGRPPVSNDFMFEDIVAMIRSMLSLNQGQEEVDIRDLIPPCFDCGELPDGKQREHCNQCNLVCSCSGECQELRWKSEEDKAACENLPQTVKREEPLIWTNEQKNSLKIKEQVLKEYHSQAVVDATLKGLNIVDCVISIDLMATPLEVDVVSADEIALPDKTKDFFDVAPGGLKVVLLQRNPNRPFTKREVDPDGRTKIVYPAKVDSSTLRYFFPPQIIVGRRTGYAAEPFHG